MGTKIGASSAHLADADPTNRLMKPVSTMMPVMVTGAGMAIACSMAAPFRAINTPRLDSLKAKMNCAIKNMMTR